MENPLNEDMPRWLWNQAKEVCNLLGINRVSTRYKGKEYTYSRITSDNALVEFYIVVSKP